MSLDDADHHVDARLLPSSALGEHFVRLADAGSSAEEDLQTATALLSGFAQEGLRRGPVAVGVHFTDFALDASSCRLSSSTLTWASPRIPNVGPTIERWTSCLTCSS